MNKSIKTVLILVGLALFSYLFVNNLPEITQAFQDWFGNYHIDIEPPIPGE